MKRVICEPDRKGFTLIELLVVVAILALLAAILFPVFSRARENGKRASCQSNLKQIGLGILQYVQDYDERMPFVLIGATPSGTASGRWIHTVQPYFKSYALLRCPSHYGFNGTTSRTRLRTFRAMRP
jgi:prepilin-type N-terminal cleavage/methylation domain-containing protein